MFLSDFILANHDRHYRNFGLIRNVETLAYTRPAPIYDTGSSLWHDRFTLDGPADYHYTAKPFGTGGMDPKQQIKLFERPEWLDVSRLMGFADEVSELLAENPVMTVARRKAVIKGLQKNIDYITDFL